MRSLTSLNTIIETSLAHYDGDANPGAQRQLGTRHFQTVDETTTQYDQHRAGIPRKLEDELALEREERWDGFQSSDSQCEAKRRTNVYREDRTHTPHGHAGAAYANAHAPSSQFRPMVGYTKTPPSQRTAPPPQVSSPFYGGQQQGHAGYTPPGYDLFGKQKLPPMQPQGTPLKVTSSKN
ncbi:uncharacterized protein PAC_03328 [Phialocephala subalpina]|uniref:Uncharacterized protein n=1 Tax=Phialocephala subalpina TaxID=576137 RepID=A0A1L7WL06_9HELO|nr:uncharacterized protein PAC_03328 [Phialocephala subalpina]